MKSRKGAIICVAVACALVAGGILVGNVLSRKAQEDALRQNAEGFLSVMLNVPDEELKAAYDRADLEAIEPLTEALVGEYVVPEYIQVLMAGDSLSTLNLSAIIQGFTSQVLSLDVTYEKQWNQCRYEAELLLTREEGGETWEVSVSGLTQLNEDGKITAATLNGQELTAFYRDWQRLKK